MRKISGASHYLKRLEVYAYVGVASGSNLLASFSHQVISGASHYLKRIEVYTYVGAAEGGNLLASFSHQAIRGGFHNFMKGVNENEHDF